MNAPPQLLLTDKPFLAVVYFKDGTNRQVGFKETFHDHKFVHFIMPSSKDGPTVMVNIDQIVTMELHTVAAPAGSA